MPGKRPLRPRKTAHASPRRGYSPSQASRTNRSTLKRLLDQAETTRGRLPTDQDVELATLVKQTPSGGDWSYEIKFDGYRMLCRVDRGKAQFISRNHHDWTKKFPELARAAASLPVKTAMLDGEIVALDADGTTHFQTLQNVFQSGRTSELIYYAFDILHLDGHDLRDLPLEQRKEILEALLAIRAPASIRYSDHLQGTGSKIFAQACRMHLEGIICKRKDQPYRPGRGSDWLKVKCSNRAEFVIAGFTPPEGARSHFGALLVGYYDAHKRFQYAGRVGTGFNQRTLAMLHKQFGLLVQLTSPFVNLSGTTGQARGVRWLKPRLVAEIEFSNWTKEGLLRHPSFQGLREDKPASEVVRDTAISVGEAKRSKQPHGATKRKVRAKLHRATRTGRKRTARKK